MKKIGSLACLIFLTVIFSTIQSHAEIRLPALIGDNMVLQQKSKINVWGWSDPAEKIYITTSWSNKTDSATGTRDAKWYTTIQTPAAGGPYTITIKGSNTITLKNIMIGEVWVCSGQSNMEMNTDYGLPQMEEEIRKGGNPHIRLFQSPRNTALTPQEDAIGKWTEANPESLKKFSGTAYFFAQKLNENLHVPIGLILSSWGGTPAEVWTPRELVENNHTLSEASERLVHRPGWPYQSGRAYNAMIAPLTNYNIAGAIWYQGESNVNTATTYTQLMKTMIGSWRQMWNKSFPFYFVQIAPYSYGDKNMGAILREAQTQTLTLENTGMVVITDLVDNIKDIHPKDKKDVGYRLANLALGDHYKVAGITYKFPMYREMSVSGNKATISFDNVPNGFILKNGNTAREFFIAGNDKRFYPADVKINGSELEVSSPKVAVPVAVRFGFTDTGTGNIFSKEGLPVNPFRTDSWEADPSGN